MRYSFLFLFLFILGCSSPSRQEGMAENGVPVTPPPSTEKSWAGGMQKMSSALQSLMPYLYSQQEFSNPKNEKKIVKGIEEFRSDIDLIPQHIGEAMLGKDPLIKFSMDRMLSNAQNAERAFLDGHKEFARKQLQENTALCFNCHTTSQIGPQKVAEGLVLKADFKIMPTEKADYYVATRQYDKAIEVLETMLDSPTIYQDNPNEIISGLKKYLALEVRIKQDPSRAAMIIEKLLIHRKLPYFFASDAEAWLKGLRDWQMEKGVRAQTVSEAKRLLNKTKSMSDLGGYQTAYVDYLRAAQTLRNALMSAADGQARSEIYQYLGKTYDKLADIGTWDFPEMYYEACIRTRPNSAVAKNCFRDFERTLVIGYSGSSGIHIPKEEQKRLAELKELAGIKSKE